MDDNDTLSSVIQKLRRFNSPTTEHYLQLINVFLHLASSTRPSTTASPEGEVDRTNWPSQDDALLIGIMVLSNGIPGRELLPQVQQALARLRKPVTIITRCRLLRKKATLRVGTLKQCLMWELSEHIGEIPERLIQERNPPPQDDRPLIPAAETSSILWNSPSQLFLTAFETSFQRQIDLCRGEDRAISLDASKRLTRGRWCISGAVVVVCTTTRTVVGCFAFSAHSTDVGDITEAEWAALAVACLIGSRVHAGVILTDSLVACSEYTRRRSDKYSNYLATAVASGFQGRVLYRSRNANRLADHVAGLATLHSCRSGKWRAVDPLTFTPPKGSIGDISALCGSESGGHRAAINEGVAFLNSLSPDDTNLYCPPLFKQMPHSLKKPVGRALLHAMSLAEIAPGSLLLFSRFIFGNVRRRGCRGISMVSSRCSQFLENKFEELFIQSAPSLHRSAPRTSPISRCIRLAQEGDLGAAYRALNPSPVMDPATLSEDDLLSLFPASHEELIVDSPRWSPAILQSDSGRDSIDSVMLSLRRTDLVKAAGPDGICFGALLAAYEEDALAFKDFIVKVANGLLAPFFRGTRLVLLRKPNGKPRPICIASTVRRVIGKAMMAEWKGKGGVSSLSPHQFGVGVPAGTESVVFLSRALQTANPGHGLLFFDAVNAFNSVRRSSILRGIKQCAPTFLSYFQTFYSQPSKAVCYSQTGLPVREISMSTGVQQGCVAGSLFYCAAVEVDVLRGLREEFPSAVISAVVDDTFIFSTPQQAGVLTQSYIRRMHHIGITVGKECVLAPCISPQDRLSYENANLPVLSEGMERLGTAFGTADYIRAWGTRKAAEFNSALSSISPLFRQHPQVALALLTSCILPMVTYVLRTTPFLLLNNFCKSVTVSARTALLSILDRTDLHCNQAQTDLRWLQASLPAHMGGISLRLPSRQKFSAFLGSYMQARLSISRMVGTNLPDQLWSEQMFLDKSDDYTLKSLRCAVAESTSHIASQFGDRFCCTHQVHILSDPTFYDSAQRKIEGTPLRHPQRWLQSKFDLGGREYLLSNATSHHCAAVRSLSSSNSYANAFISFFPSAVHPGINAGPTRPLSSEFFRIALQARLVLPDPYLSSICTNVTSITCKCGHVIAKDDDLHLYSCGRSDGLVQRHDAVMNTILAIARCAGFSTLRDRAYRPIGYAEHKKLPDGVLLDFTDGTPLALDLTVSNPLVDKYKNHAPTTAAYASFVNRGKKFKEYLGRLPSVADCLFDDKPLTVNTLRPTLISDAIGPTLFLPLSIETHGACSPEIPNLLSAFASRRSESMSNEFGVLYYSLYKNLYTKLLSNSLVYGFATSISSLRNCLIARMTNVTGDQNSLLDTGSGDARDSDGIVNNNNNISLEG